jgi:hypothetical protein
VGATRRRIAEALSLLAEGLNFDFAAGVIAPDSWPTLAVLTKSGGKRNRQPRDLLLGGIPSAVAHISQQWEPKAVTDRPGFAGKVVVARGLDLCHINARRNGEGDRG